MTSLYGMGYKTKLQVIKRAKSRQWYVCFPSALAQALELEPSEVVEWVVEGDGKLVLKRSGGEECREVKRAGKGKRKGASR